MFFTTKITLKWLVEEILHQIDVLNLSHVKGVINHWCCQKTANQQKHQHKAATNDTNDVAIVYMFVISLTLNDCI